MKFRKHKRKLLYNGDEKLLISLHEVAKETTDSEIRATAFSLLKWYQRRGEWTYPQKDFGRQLVAGHRKTEVLREPKKLKAKPSYSLYAVRIGSELKVGYSTNVNGRIKSYRTGTADVELMAVINLGECSKQHAKNQERRLHKNIRAHRIEREIFSLAAVEHFKAWVPAVEKEPAKRLPRHFESRVQE